MYYLYIKTHNKTGMKYLGKTTQDPYTYKGSGKDWITHIKYYGDDVTTEIIGTYTTNKELRENGRYYSKLWNIVESNEWANRIPETGGGPGAKHGKDNPFHTRAGAFNIATKAKDYIAISPLNEIIQIHNMRQFCRDNNLDQSAMVKLLMGKKYNHYKGWRAA